MKKRFFLLTLILALAASSTFASSLEYIWSWRPADPDVKYFRYHTDDDPEWRYAEDDSFRAHYWYDNYETHTLYIQQSYDGVHWSDTSEKTYNVIHEYMLPEELDGYNEYAVSLFYTPYNSYLVKNPRVGEEYISTYSTAVDLSAVRYFGKYLGIGVMGGADFAWKSFSENPNIYLDAYVTPVFRLIANNRFDLSLKGGAGVHLEFPEEGYIYTTEAVIQVEATIRISRNFHLAVAPSYAIAEDILNNSSAIAAHTAKMITFGIEWQK